MNPKTDRSFPLGQLVATPNALQTIPQEDVFKALSRHAACDWGECSPEDWAENEPLPSGRSSPLLGLPRPKRGQVLDHHRGRPVGNDGALARGLLKNY